MQTATFIKTIKWIYSLELDESLEFFRRGLNEIQSGQSEPSIRIEDAYLRGVALNSKTCEIEDHRDATRVLDVFGLTDLYDAEWWQSVVSSFLQLLALRDKDVNRPI